MENLRKPFQGTVNIIRFNWHFYAFAVTCLIATLILTFVLTPDWKYYMILMSIVVILPVAISLLISWYIYDFSPLYKFQFVKPGKPGSQVCINIHSGFDETSRMLKEKNNCAQFLVFDFYDPVKHTEISIRRARKAYPSFPGTRSISTDFIPCENHSADRIYLIFAAHEIRNDEERNTFFKELSRILKADGDIVIVEHMRDKLNFIAYNIGFFHFLPRKLWLNQFNKSGFFIADEGKPNPFITYFRLKKNGSPY
ncbi:class I SAM-dependent methyltransferase [Pollutibacter soli]|uniref:class I SAM-dependent methyltransferase n=1 Tax=Pollutibacter soli TaxID=3034157 RepID=UPI0030133E23